MTPGTCSARSRYRSSVSAAASSASLREETSIITPWKSFGRPSSRDIRIAWSATQTMRPSLCRYRYSIANGSPVLSERR